MSVMSAMISRSLLLATSFLLVIGQACADPIGDCNQIGDTEKQIEGCNQFLELEPYSPYVALAYGLRGGAYKQTGDLDRAIADFTQALKIDAGLVRVYVNRGIAYRDKGQLDQAIADFSQAIALDAAF